MPPSPHTSPAPARSAGPLPPCFRGLAWGLLLQAAGTCTMLLAPLPLPVPGNIRAQITFTLAASLAMGNAGLAVLAWYAARLAPHAWGNPAGQSRRRTWGLRLLGVLAALTWAWGAALLVPAALRRGDRRAARLAGFGGALGFAVWWIFHLWRDTAISSPLGWGLYAALALSGICLWFALRRLHAAPSRALCLAGWAAILAVLLTVAALPGWRIPRMAARADALTASVLATAGYADANAPFAAARPPVPPEADPVAALDPDAIDRTTTDWTAFLLASKAARPTGTDAPQLTPADLAALDAWFAAHPDFMAAADAVSTPGYRSCLPAASGPGDIAWGNTAFLEPRLDPALTTKWIAALDQRARAACARGDIPAALADIRRLAALAEAGTREPTLIGCLVANVATHSIVQHILPERLDLWDEASLSAIEDILEARVRGGPANYAQAVALETIGVEATIPELFKEWHRPDLHRHPMQSPRDGKTLCWIHSERIAYATAARRALDTAAAIAAMPPGPDRAAAWQTFRDEAPSDRDVALLGAIFIPDYTALFRSLVLAPEDDLACLRIAAAAARYHRAHGTLPPTLDALVPDYLPALPLEALTGVPPLYTPSSDAPAFHLDNLPAFGNSPRYTFYLSPPSAP